MTKQSMKNQDIKTEDLLFELGMEELPTKAVKQLSLALVDLLKAELESHKLSFENITPIATPRRLGFIIKALQTKQASYTEQRRGPALNAAFDKDNNFTKAAIGFANSCGTKPEKLERCETTKGAWLIYNKKVQGLETSKILEPLLTTLLKKLPIAKHMRWSSHSFSFVRPVHWALLLFGSKTIKIKLFNIETNNKTFGHRFMAQAPIIIKSINEYEQKLKKAFVITNFDTRKQEIESQVHKTIAAHNKNLITITETNTDDYNSLLEEVTSLVEWPVALMGGFDKKYLDVPKECLISSMITHQKYFPVLNNKTKKLEPYFVFIANIKSKKSKQVILGNEKVLSARLSDAEFFYNKDKDSKLSDRIEKLGKVIYQKKLGSLLDKTHRTTQLSTDICKLLKTSKKNSTINLSVVEHATRLIKADLTTEMVFEFPELQGIMGKYYAINDGENSLTADIIEQHYKPKFAGDTPPDTIEACIIAIADKLDTLCGIFAIGQKPTGEKDPFSLRRAALGVLRILIEKEIDLDIKDLISLAVNNYSQQLKLDSNKINSLISECLDFCLDRLKSYYTNNNITVNLFYSVKNINSYSPYDFNQRLLAVNKFTKLPESKNLIAANKRVKNILSKSNTINTNNLLSSDKTHIDIDNILNKIDHKYIEQKEEQELYSLLNAKNNNLKDEFSQNNYTKILQDLSTLQKPIDNFFDNVMVNCDDVKIKNNRLLLLKSIQYLFNKVADISELN